MLELEGQENLSIFHYFLKSAGKNLTHWDRQNPRVSGLKDKEKILTPVPARTKKEMGLRGSLEIV